MGTEVGVGLVLEILCLKGKCGTNEEQNNSTDIVYFGCAEFFFLPLFFILSHSVFLFLFFFIFIIHFYPIIVVVVKFSQDVSQDQRIKLCDDDWSCGVQ